MAPVKVIVVVIVPDCEYLHPADVAHIVGTADGPVASWDAVHVTELGGHRHTAAAGSLGLPGCSCGFAR